MFLAIEEIRQNKVRYGLICGLLFLIAYLVFFLSSLAYGLMQANRAAVDKWQADTVLLSSEANRLLSASRVKAALLDQVEAEDKAILAQRSIVIWPKGNSSVDEREQASLFGLDQSSFLMPNIIEGRAFKKDFEVVVDQSLLDKTGYELGQEIELSGSDQTLTIVGLTDQATYNVAPVIYLTTEDFQELMAANNPQVKDLVSAILVKGNLNDYPREDLEALDIETFISKIPGYQPQNLTFAFMIGFLIVIAAIVIGIFIFVLTSQKSQMFGLMKIQGLSNTYISRSVLIQTLILSGLGTGTGLLMTYLSSLVLPSSVPFENNWTFYGLISLAMLTFALLGALFSVRLIVKVDPLKSLN